MITITSFVRRRRSLIIPVGPCGVGKSTFASALRTGSGPACCLSVFDRDQVFAEHRGLVMPTPPGAHKCGLEGQAGTGAGDGSTAVDHTRIDLNERNGEGLNSWDLSEENLHAVIDNVWDACGQCGASGQARRLATLMHAISAANPDAARAIGKPSSKWFKQRPRSFVLKSVKGGQHLVTRAAEVTEYDEHEQQARKHQKVASSSSDAAASRVKHCLVLGVEQHASAETIRKRYHTLARTMHPDKGGNDSEFAAIKSSYEALLGVRMVTLREALQATHSDLVQFLTPPARKEWTLGAPAEHNDANCVAPDGTTLLLDSTNGAPDGRDHARRLSSAARIVLVQLRPKHMGEQLEQWMLGRVANRRLHPAFPSDDAPEKQLRKVRDVMKGMCWLDEDERAKIVAATPTSSGGSVIECDPSDEAALSNLPYQVWACVFVADAVRGQVGL